MRKQKVLAITLIAIATLLLGIGYAGYNPIDLKIAGTAKGSYVADSETEVFKVEFDSTTPTTTTSADYITVTDATITDGTNAVMNVEGLKYKGDYATATYTVINNSKGIEASLAAVTATTNNDKYFKVTATSEDGTEEYPNIDVNETTTITVKVELIYTPVSQDETGDINVTFTATAVEPEA